MAKKPAEVVLVHGAWHDAWCWTPVADILDREGIKWHAPDLALRSEKEDADRVRELIDQASGDVVVVGHSRGGGLISTASLDAPNVRHLVYIAAVMLCEGQTTMQNRRPSLRDMAVRVEGDHTVVDPLHAKALLYADCDDEVAAQAIDRLRPSALRDPSRPLDGPAGWQTIPSTYVLCSEDRCLHPDDQREMAVWATHVVELVSSHSAMLSHPGEMAHLIVDRARNV